MNPLSFQATYQEFIPMITKKVGSISKKFNIDFNDLYNQGYLIFHNCKIKYDPDLSSFSTWLFTNLDFLLTRYCLNYNKNNNFTVSIEDIYSKSCFFQDKKYKFINMKISLSTESQYIVNLLIKKPKELILFQGNRKMTQEILKEFLRIKNWKHQEIDYCFKEIKLGLKTL